MMYLPQSRAVVCLCCIVLFCTFYWDLVVLRLLHSSRHPTRSHGNRGIPFYSWSWECVGEDELPERCHRVISNSHSKSRKSLATCVMTCSPGRSLWPQPTGDVRASNSTASFLPQNLRVAFTPVDSSELSDLLKKATKLYEVRISNLARKSHRNATFANLDVELKVTKSSKDLKYKINIDESYKLIIKRVDLTVRAVIQASNFLGACHGLETLFQLIWWDEFDEVLKILSSVVIKDAPVFTYRGLMLDTARNFIPVSSILRTLDAMSMNKLNVFHWRLTDSKSFPYVSQKYPNLNKYSTTLRKEVYSRDDVIRVVKYAEVRGLAVLIEVGAPALKGHWSKGLEEKGIPICLNDTDFSEFCSKPPCGKLNPANHSFEVVFQVLKELQSTSKSPNLLHIGGDVFDFRCWKISDDFIESEVYLDKEMVKVWKSFYERLVVKRKTEKIFQSHFISWSNSDVFESNAWNKLSHASLIVQSRGPSSSGELEKLVKKKLRVIASSSDAWFLNEPHAWQSVYLHRPWVDLKPGERKLVLGGEACVWTEHLDDLHLDPRVWPAASAVAERLWTDPRSGPLPSPRLDWFRENMLHAGILSSPVNPKWCSQNPYECL